jgi:hypothetical protein
MKKLLTFLIVVLSLTSIILPIPQVTCEEFRHPLHEKLVNELHQTPVFFGFTKSDFQLIVYQNPQTKTFTVVDNSQIDEWVVVDHGTGSIVQLPEPTGPSY